MGQRLSGVMWKNTGGCEQGCMLVELEEENVSTVAGLIRRTGVLPSAGSLDAGPGWGGLRGLGGRPSHEGRLGRSWFLGSDDHRGSGSTYLPSVIMGEVPYLAGRQCQCWGAVLAVVVDPRICQNPGTTLGQGKENREAIIGSPSNVQWIVCWVGSSPQAPPQQQPQQQFEPWSTPQQLAHCLPRARSGFRLKHPPHSAHHHHPPIHPPPRDGVLFATTGGSGFDNAHHGPWNLSHAMHPAGSGLTGQSDARRCMHSTGSPNPPVSVMTAVFSYREQSLRLHALPFAVGPNAAGNSRRLSARDERIWPTQAPDARRLTGGRMSSLLTARQLPTPAPTAPPPAPTQAPGRLQTIYLEPPRNIRAIWHRHMRGPFGTHPAPTAEPAHSTGMVRPWPGQPVRACLSVRRSHRMREPEDGVGEGGEVG